MDASDVDNIVTGQQSNLTELAVEIIEAYVSNNRVQAVELPALITSVHGALGRLGQPSLSDEPEREKLTPAQIRKSITHDALISFIDGKGYKTLRRHLTKHGLSEKSYRARYGLPVDYPMTAPSYSETRSALARSLGLGRKAGGVAAAAVVAVTEEPAPSPDAPKRGGRRKKTRAETE